MKDKKLIVYLKDSCYKYSPLFSRFLYQVDEKGYLFVWYRDSLSGKETDAACFKEWDYYFVEEGNEY